MRALIIGFPAILILGCAAPGGYWDHAHHDPAQFQRDAAQCAYEAAAARPGSTGGTGIGVSISQDIAAGVQRGELEGMCMRARGYYFVTR